MKHPLVLVMELLRYILFRTELTVVPRQRLPKRIFFFVFKKISLRQNIEINPTDKRNQKRKTTQTLYDPVVFF